MPLQFWSESREGTNRILESTKDTRMSIKALCYITHLDFFKIKYIGHKSALEEAINFYEGPVFFSGLPKIQQNQRQKKIRIVEPFISNLVPKVG